MSILMNSIELSDGMNKSSHSTPGITSPYNEKKTVTIDLTTKNNGKATPLSEI